MSIRRMIPADAAACDAILAKLPYFFPDPVGVANAASDVRRNAGWVSQDDGVITGFLSLAWSTPEAAEIAWMAVDPNFRRGGRGRSMVECAADHARAEGAKMLFLFASPVTDPPDVADGFEATRRFYVAQGFVPLCVIKPEGWSAEHLLMVRSLR